MQTATNVRERWGEQVRLARLMRRDSQAAAGEATGLSGPSVARAEQGQGGIDAYDRLARHYGLTLELGQVTEASDERAS